MVDRKITYPSLCSHYKVTMEANNYKNNQDQHQWINTVISNLKSFLQGTSASEKIPTHGIG